MVVMYSREQVNGIVAMSVDVQKALAEETAAAAGRAKTILSTESEVRTGESYITVEAEWVNDDYDHIDWFIVLNDEKSDWPGAMTIEFGRTGARGGGPSRPVAPLRKAVGLF